MKIASGTNHYKPILTLSRLPMTKDFLVPINGTHRTGNASFGTTLWTQLALCHQVHWVFIAFHRQCLNLLPSNLKTALQDVGRFKPNRVTY